MWDEREDELTPPADREPLTGPDVVLSLPDGQTLRAQLLLRRRDATGEWWATVAVPLWARVDRADGSAAAEPTTIELMVPMHLLRPLEEARASYARVPTIDRTRSRPWVIVWEAPPPLAGPPGVLHRADCGQARAWGAETLDDLQTLHSLLAAPAADRDPIGYCELCRPQTAPEMIRLLNSARPATAPPRTLADTLRPTERRPRP